MGNPNYKTMDHLARFTTRSATRQPTCRARVSGDVYDAGYSKFLSDDDIHDRLLRPFLCFSHIFERPAISGWRHQYTST